MIEKTVIRNGEKITEVRSEGGKLLYLKTKDGYEMKCPRTKQICVVRYEQMLFDCLKCFSGISNEDELLSRSRKIRELLAVSQG
jgi:hypothetical protein